MLRVADIACVAAVADVTFGTALFRDDAEESPTALLVPPSSPLPNDSATALAAAAADSTTPPNVDPSK